jgi:hypothetical protein
MSYIEIEQKNQKPSPEQDILYCGLVIKAPLETIRQIKQYILAETDAKLIYQHKDVRYLRVEAVNPSTQDTAEKEAFYTTP